MLHASLTSYSMVTDPYTVHVYSFKSHISTMQTTATESTLSRRRGVSKNANTSWTDEGHSLQINKACIQEHEPVWPDGGLLSSKLVSVFESTLAHKSLQVQLLLFMNAVLRPRSSPWSNKTLQTVHTAAHLSERSLWRDSMVLEFDMAATPIPSPLFSTSGIWSSHRICH